MFSHKKFIKIMFISPCLIILVLIFFIVANTKLPDIPALFPVIDLRTKVTLTGIKQFLKINVCVIVSVN